jgi:hypothetical protein
MPLSPLQNPDRFGDPLGDHMQAAVTARSQHLATYPQVEEVYQAFYLRFDAYGKRGQSYLGGAEGIVGTKLFVKNGDEGLGLAARDEQYIALFDGEAAEQIHPLLELGWTLHFTLAFSLYSSEGKTFTGEVACMCYSPELDGAAQSALEAFVDGITNRIGAGTHPELELTQEQFVKVVESDGAWFLTKELPYPQLPKGTVYYRRRKSVNDRLVAQALDGNKGCVVASWVGLGVVILVALLLVWLFVVPLFVG